ncbi:MAG TPA: hypothetical protein P5125_02365, partial [Kiritimatiellia bacterium]|nr:hypothetical protein [Kiritimatiellia bacterium]
DCAYTNHALNSHASCHQPDYCALEHAIDKATEKRNLIFAVLALLGMQNPFVPKVQITCPLVVSEFAMLASL